MEERKIGCPLSLNPLYETSGRILAVITRQTKRGTLNTLYSKWVYSHNSDYRNAKEHPFYMREPRPFPFSVTSTDCHTFSRNSHHGEISQSFKRLLAGPGFLRRSMRWSKPGFYGEKRRRRQKMRATKWKSKAGRQIKTAIATSHRLSMKRLLRYSIPRPKWKQQPGIGKRWG